MRIFSQAFELIHDQQPSCASFLTCRRCIFNSSVIPEILSLEDCERLLQNNGNLFFQEKMFVWLKIFVMSDTMQFASRMCFESAWDAEEFRNDILLPLLETKKYFSCSLKYFDCQSEFRYLQDFSRIRSLTDLRCDQFEITDENTWSALHHFRFLNKLWLGNCSDISSDAIRLLTMSCTSGKEARKPLATVRHLTVESICDLEEFLKNFPNLQYLCAGDSHGVDFSCFPSLVPSLTELDLCCFRDPKNVHCLSSLTNLRRLALTSLIKMNSIEGDDETDQERTKSSLFGSSSSLCPTLTKLTISNCDSSREIVIKNDFSNLSNLRHVTSLTLINLGSFTNKDVTEIEYLTQLRVLQLSQLGSMTGKSFGKFKSLIHLEELTVRNCDLSLTPDCLDFVSALQQLKLLSLPSCGLADEHLERISICGSSSSSAAAAVEQGETISQNGHHPLTTLVLTWNQNITNRGLDSFLKYFDELEEVRLDFCMQISDLSVFRKMKRLERLYLGVCSALTDSSFRAFTINGNNDDENNNNNSIKDIFPKLRTLHVTGCSNLSEQFIIYMSQNTNITNNLQTFWFSTASADWNREGIDALVKFQNLKQVSAVPFTNPEDLKYLRENMKNVSHCF